MNLTRRFISFLFGFLLITYPIHDHIPVSAQDDTPYWPTQEWHTATSESQGIDSALLAPMLTAFQEQRFAEVHSILVIRHGTIVLEAYGYPYQADTLHSLQGATKGITAALVGSAIQQGFITSVDQPVLDFFPERTFANLDENKRAITLADLLTMRSGLPVADVSEDVWQTDDYTQAILDQSMSTEPGTTFLYNRMASILLGLIVAETSGQDTQSFAVQHLFEPLGISNFRWDDVSPGTVNADTGLWLTPRDLAKIGYLYLHNGVWEDNQILPPDWVTASTSVQVNEALFFNEPIADAYGYQWWVYDQGYYMVAAYGAQAVIVQPDLDLIVVFTGGTDVGNYESFPRSFFESFILPAIVSADPLPENPEGQTQLENAILTFAQPETTPVPASPAFAQDLSNRVYTLESNPAGWSTLELHFEPDQPEASLIVNGEALQVGLDGAFRLNDRPDIPWLLRGEWVGDTAFQIDWVPLGYPFPSQWLLRFEDMSVNVRLKDTGFYSSTVTRFTGSAQP